MHPVIELVHQHDQGKAVFEVAVRYPPSVDDEQPLRISIGKQQLVGPTAWPIEIGHEDTLAGAWQWYLEQYGSRPVFGLNRRVRRIVEGLYDWGEQAFQTLFGDGVADGLFDIAAGDAGGRSLRVEVHSPDPQILAWPWEWMRLAEGPLVGWLLPIERRFVAEIQSQRVTLAPSQRTIRVLMLSARTNLMDVDVRLVSLPLAKRADLNLTLVRPPTLERLREMLETGSGWDVLHIDCHGELKRLKTGLVEPHLLFEQDDGRPHAVGMRPLCDTLRTGCPRHIVLNACRSAMPTRIHEGGQSSIATQLLTISDLVDVTAMAYNLQTSAAVPFMEQFYAALAAQDDPTLAVWHGQMVLRGDRDGQGGPGPRPTLLDWSTPVVYRRSADVIPTPEKEFVVQHTGARLHPPCNAPKFVGREAEMFLFDRALSARTSAIVVVHGLAGQGKTRFIDEALWWRHRTGDTRSIVAVDASSAGTIEDIVSQIRAAVDGQFAQGSGAILSAATACPLLLVIDEWPPHLTTDFPAGNPEGALNVLLDLIDNLAANDGAVIIASKAPLPWLSSSRNVSELAFGGLDPWACVSLANELIAGASPTNGIDIDEEELHGLAYCVAGNPRSLEFVARAIASGHSVSKAKANFRTGMQTFEEDFEGRAKVALNEIIGTSSNTGVTQLIVSNSLDGGTLPNNPTARKLQEYGLSHLGVPHPALLGILRRRGYSASGRDEEEFTALANSKAHLSVKRRDWRDVYADSAGFHNETRQEAFERRQLALRHAAEGDYDEARRLLRDGVEFDAKLEEPIAMAMNLSSLAEVEAKSGNLRAAEEAFHQAVWVFELYGQQRDAAISYNQWAAALHRAGREWSAGELLIAAAQLFEKMEDPTGEKVRWGYQNYVREIPENIGRAMIASWEDAGLPSLALPRLPEDRIKGQRHLVARLYDTDGAPRGEATLPIKDIT